MSVIARKAFEHRVEPAAGEKGTSVVKRKRERSLLLSSYGTLH